MGCDYLSRLGLNLIYVSEIDHLYNVMKFIVRVNKEN